MIIASADTGSALLDGYYKPIKLITTVAVIVSPPYTSPLHYISRYTEISPKTTSVIVEELKLIRELLSRVKVRIDVIHLDITMRGLDLSEVELSDIDALGLSRRAKDSLRALLPIVKPYAKLLKEEFGVPVLAIGKESVPIRIAELITAAESVLYGIQKCLDMHSKILIGLPKRVSIIPRNNVIEAVSLEPTEELLRFKVKVKPPNLMDEVSLLVYPNPIARGFNVVEIKPMRSKK